MQFNIAIHKPTNVYIAQLKVLVQSIRECYDDDVKISVYYTGVDETIMQNIDNRCGIIYKEVRPTKELNRLITRSGNLAPYKLNTWYELLKDGVDKRQVFVDCDMLVYQKVDKFFTDDFDIAYTYKTEEEEVIKKPINSGVVLVNNSKLAREFFMKWRDDTNKFIYTNPQYVGEWGAWDQHVFGAFIGRRLIAEYSDVINCGGVRLKGYPCKNLNVITCAETNKDMYIIHYKGMWRNVLTAGVWKNSGKDELSCTPMYRLWCSMFDKFNKGRG